MTVNLEILLSGVIISGWMRHGMAGGQRSANDELSNYWWQSWIRDFSSASKKKKKRKSILIQHQFIRPGLIFHFTFFFRLNTPGARSLTTTDLNRHACRFKVIDFDRRVGRWPRSFGCFLCWCNLKHRRIARFFLSSAQSLLSSI